MSKVTLQNKTEIEFTFPDTMELVKIGENVFEVKVKSELPKTWEEFCKTHPIEVRKEAYCSGNLAFLWFTTSSCRDKCTWPNKQYAEAALALCQLVQLRDCYNDGWMPDWTDRTSDKFAIYFNANKVETTVNGATQRVLAFETAKLRDKFLENFRNLIEIAKPLL